MNQVDPHAHLRAAFQADCRIQAWHLNGITREQAIAIAIDAALKHGRQHSYVAEPFMPHDWVIEAVLAAVNGITSNDGRWDTLTPPDGRAPEFGCEPHLYRVFPADRRKAPADTVPVEHYRKMGNIVHDLTTCMQAAYIEWRHGKGAESAMQWIFNSLWGPGLIPDEDAEFGKEAQAWFDSNRAEPFPRCECGRPSHIIWMSKGFCGREHYEAARAREASP